ncbi:hypothetical protein SARC_00070 [Sphaeroforma arctica JP610]|uniref:Peptidase S74 domain-containing protein n=1 Tax=Sphaeroforma arctica JP610 TaxID=667725 RepID=A0A0L0GHJ3_9EUKA|nr:hypothetical protein SARC_00070 [Sphaeroforma arctica JP610]KNC87813.1 hypothetical protein SARC_00070 [Sphaeroforma arctica JP610]|eukprot:XP_014161715.1 hypothetical protein SARC_00070 [Sphaeroforma arctica JP610]
MLSTGGTTNVRLGRSAGNTNQSRSGVAVGNNTGSLNQSSGATAIGQSAGHNSQGADALAVGSNSGETDQSKGAIAVGSDAGRVNQGVDAVAVGSSAGEANQGPSAVAIGKLAGNYSQAAKSIIINASGNVLNSSTNGLFVDPIRNVDMTDNVLYYNPILKEIVYGAATMQSPTYSGDTFVEEGVHLNDFLSWDGTRWVPNRNSTGRVGISSGAGETNQGPGAVAVGNDAGNADQGKETLAVGNNTGSDDQGANSVAVGNGAASTSQGGAAVAIGHESGMANQGDVAVAVGTGAGKSGQSASAVAIGNESGMANQGDVAVAVGTGAGKSGQSASAVAIGEMAGQTNQGAKVVAIGTDAGKTNQGSCAVAIGKKAGELDQADNSIILNATGVAVNASTSGFFVDPIRNENRTDKVLYYNTTLKEIVYGIPVAAAEPSEPVPDGVTVSGFLGWDGTGWVTGTVGIAIGSLSGVGQDTDAIAIGFGTGSAQKFNAIAIGNGTASTGQRPVAIAIGSGSGLLYQMPSAIGIGRDSSKYLSGSGSVAIGTSAMQGGSSELTGGFASIALGFAACSDGVQEYCTSLGAHSMSSNATDRTDVLAIGVYACNSVSSNNTIVLNGTGAGLGNAVPDSFVVKPIRNAAGPNELTYNPVTGEITYATSSLETKENIKVFDRETGDILEQLVVKEFNFKNKNKYIHYDPVDPATILTVAEWDEIGDEVIDKGETQFGFVADEVQEIIPELVYADPSGAAQNIKWNSVTAMLVKQNQALTSRIAALSARFTTLSNLGFGS